MNETHIHEAGQLATPAPVTPSPKTETDPVCGMKVAANPAKSVEHQGQHYFFCSQRCIDKFRACPTQYVTATARASLSPEIEAGHRRCVLVSRRRTVLPRHPPIAAPAATQA